MFKTKVTTLDLFKTYYSFKGIKITSYQYINFIKECYNFNTNFTTNFKTDFDFKIDFNFKIDFDFKINFDFNIFAM